MLVTQQGIDSHFDDPLTHLMVSTQAREHVVRQFATSRWPWVAMGGGGYSLDAVRRAWSMEFLIMLDAPIPAELHEWIPGVEGDRRAQIDAAVDAAAAGASVRRGPEQEPIVAPRGSPSTERRSFSRAAAYLGGAPVLAATLILWLGAIRISAKRISTTFLRRDRHPLISAMLETLGTDARRHRHLVQRLSTPSSSRPR